LYYLPLGKKIWPVNKYPTWGFVFSSYFIGKCNL